jgi:putative ABC transport system permease protein
VVIDAGTADREGYSIGDTIAVQAAGRSRRCGSPASAPFGDVDSIGTATFALFDLHAAQQLFHKSGGYTEILVGGPDSVRKQLSASLGDSLQVQTAAANDRFTLDGLKMFVKFLKISCSCSEESPYSWARSRSTTRSRSPSRSARVS